MALAVRRQAPASTASSSTIATPLNPSFFQAAAFSAFMSPGVTRTISVGGGLLGLGEGASGARACCQKAVRTISTPHKKRLILMPQISEPGDWLAQGNLRRTEDRRQTRLNGSMQHRQRVGLADQFCVQIEVPVQAPIRFSLINGAGHQKIGRVVVAL